MELDDVLKVLRIAAEYDDRVVTAQMAMAWHPVIGQYAVQDAVSAVIKHYGESTDRIMPAHVRKLIPTMRDERERREGRRAAPLALPSRYEDDPERDERNREGRARVQQAIHQILAKRNLDGTRAWEPSKLKGAKGAWWEDVDARERHANQMLAESGRLHTHCEDSSCQTCKACPCVREASGG